MRILVIDDSEERHVWFAHVLGEHSVVSAYNAEEALERFREEHFDVAFFDHDMGDGMNGSQLAYCILNDNETYNVPAYAWVHTSNSIGAMNIVAKFRSAGVPFKVMPFETFQGYPETVTDLLCKITHDCGTV